MIMKNLFWFIKKIWPKPILLSQVKGKVFVVLRTEEIIHLLVYLIPLCLSPLPVFSEAEWHRAD